jgi:phenylalanyl-tRNA synthetase beta chain
MLSEQGFGRALSSFIGAKTGLRKYSVKPSGQKVYVAKGMEEIRPFTVCAIIKDLKLDDEKVREIIQIQEKLHITFCRKRKKAAIGIYPLEKIKLPIFFEARKPSDIRFRPLEWNKELDANQILQEHPTGIEYRNLVIGMKKYAVFRDADNHILSFTPVINSHHTGKISADTKEAFLEVSGFDLHTASFVLNIMVCALSDMGASIYSMQVVYPDKTLVTPDLSPRGMKVDLGFVNSWLGLNLKDGEMKELLQRMGFGYEKGVAFIPAYRPDIIHAADLAEDIAIAYGYENFKPILPSKATTGKEDELENFRTKLARILVGLGMLETSSLHLSNEAVQFKMMLKKSERQVTLSNSLSVEHDVLRTSLLPGLLSVLRDNTHNEYPQYLFESGMVFSSNPKTETGVEETCKLACVMCNNDTDYTKIRQAIDYLFRSVGAKVEFKEKEDSSFISGRAASVIFKGKDIGTIGELHPQVLDNFKVEMPAAAFEILIDHLRAI